MLRRKVGLMALRPRPTAGPFVLPSCRLSMPLFDVTSCKSQRASVPSVFDTDANLRLCIAAEVGPTAAG